MEKYVIEIEAPDGFEKRLPNLKRYLRKKLLCKYRISHTRANGKQIIVKSKNFQGSHSSTSESKPNESDRRPSGIKKLMIKCPFCDGNNENATLVCNSAANEYFVYCDNCGIETADVFLNPEHAIKFFSQGKNVAITRSDLKKC